MTSFGWIAEISDRIIYSEVTVTYGPMNTVRCVEVWAKVLTKAAPNGVHCSIKAEASNGLSDLGLHARPEATQRDLAHQLKMQIDALLEEEARLTKRGKRK